MNAAREVLPDLPPDNTPLMRAALGGSGVLDELDLLVLDMQRVGDQAAADEIAIARARVYRVLLARLRPGQCVVERETAEMEAQR